MQITCPECHQDFLNICQGDYEANVHCLNCDYCVGEPISIEESEAMIIEYENKIRNAQKN